MSAGIQSTLGAREAARCNGGTEVGRREKSKYKARGEIKRKGTDVGGKKRERRREERELKDHGGRKHCERDGLIQWKIKNSQS